MDDYEGNSKQAEEILDALLGQLKLHHYRSLHFEPQEIVDNRPEPSYYRHAIGVYVAVQLAAEINAVIPPEVDPYFSETISTLPWPTTTSKILNCLTINKKCDHLHFRWYSFDIRDPSSFERLYRLLATIDLFYTHQLENNACDLSPSSFCSAQLQRLLHLQG